MRAKVGQRLRPAFASLAAAFAFACGENVAAEVLDDATVLYYPSTVVDAGASAGHFALVLSTDFDHRFGRGWVSRFDLAAWASASPEIWSRGPQVPSLGSRLISNGAASRTPPSPGLPTQWYLSHRGVGVVTVLDVAADDAGRPLLTCGAPAADAPPLPSALALTDCDRAHLVDLAQGLRAASAPSVPSRALFDVAALAFLPGGGSSGLTLDRLLVGTLGRADVVRGVSGRLLALDLTYGADGQQATVLSGAVDLGTGLGALLSVPADSPPPAPGATSVSVDGDASAQVIASGFPVSRTTSRLAPDPAAQGLRLAGLGPQGGFLATVGVGPAWPGPAAAPTRQVPTTTSLGGLETVGLLSDPNDPNHLVGLSRGPDAVFDLRRRPEARGLGDGNLLLGSRWVQGDLLVALPGAQPQAFTLFARQAAAGRTLAAVAGAGDDSLTLLDVGSGAILAKMNLNSDATDIPLQGVGAAGVAYMRLPAAGLATSPPRLTPLTDVLLVTLFYRHAMAIVDVSGDDPASWKILAFVVSDGPGAAKRFP